MLPLPPTRLCQVFHVLWLDVHYVESLVLPAETGGGGEPEAQKAQQAAQEERIPATSGCGQARSSVLIILYCLPEMLPILPAMHLPSMYAAPPRAQPAALSCRPAACSFGPPPV